MMTPNELIDARIPLPIVVEAADLISQWRRQNPRMRKKRVSWDASGVRTVGMRPKEFMGTREIRQVQASLVRPDKLAR
jgi:hypothetical protein